MSNESWTRRAWLALWSAALWPRSHSAEDSPATEEVSIQIPRPQDIPAVPALELNEAIRRGVDFLLLEQRSNGSWGTATLTKDLNIYAPIPGSHDAFKVAVTAMCLSALIETKDQRTDVEQSIYRGEAYSSTISRESVEPTGMRSTTSGLTAIRFRRWCGY
ncbi:MAG: hypothetical protein U0929_18160 [Planctomycetaceae bacterium]